MIDSGSFLVRHRGLSAAVVSLLMTASAQATNNCNFEDALLCGWIPGTTGGTGSTGIETHNGSKMAFAQHTGSGTHSLTQDFAYSTTDLISFVMHAVTNFGGNGTNALAGVKFSFLNAFNVPLGSAGIYNVTSTSWLGVHDSFVDNVQHDYAFTMGSVAVLAGLATTAPIAKLSVSFVTTAETNVFNNQSTAVLWFDNVTVGAVPEPFPAALLSGGLAVVLLAARRRHRDALAASTL